MILPPKLLQELYSHIGWVLTFVTDSEGKLVSFSVSGVLWASLILIIHVHS